MLENFGKRQISAIEDVTDFVRQQKEYVDSQRLGLLEVPVERGWHLQDEGLGAKIGVTV